MEYAQPAPSSPAPFSVRLATDGDTAVWDRYVEDSARATLYHRRDCLRLIHDVFGHESLAFAAFDANNDIVGVLPAVRVNSLFFGHYLVSMPFFNYGGAVGDNAEVEIALMHALAAHAASTGASHVEFRDEVERAEEWARRTDKVTMELTLPDSSEQLSKALGGKLRSQIRRPQKSGATACSGGAEYLDDFYTVFSRNMRDLGTPVYSRRFFEAFFETYPAHTAVHVVHADGRPVAAGITVRSRPGVTEIPWASSLREYNRHSVNMLLYWDVLDAAIAAGQRLFDFGRSSRGSGPFRFKRQWGAVERPLHWHYWLPAGRSLPMLSPANPKFALAIAAWKRLPLWLANRLGPGIVKNLP